MGWASGDVPRRGPGRVARSSDRPVRRTTPPYGTPDAIRNRCPCPRRPQPRHRVTRPHPRASAKPAHRSASALTPAWLVVNGVAVALRRRGCRTNARREAIARIHTHALERRFGAPAVDVLAQPLRLEVCLALGHIAPPRLRQAVLATAERVAADLQQAALPVGTKCPEAHASRATPLEQRGERGPSRGQRGREQMDRHVAVGVRLVRSVVHPAVPVGEPLELGRAESLLLPGHLPLAARPRPLREGGNPPFEESTVEAGVVGDHEVRFREDGLDRRYVQCAAPHVVVGESRQPRDECWDRPAGVLEAREALAHGEDVAVARAVGERHGGDLDDRIARGVEPGGLDVHEERAPRRRAVSWHMVVTAPLEALDHAVAPGRRQRPRHAGERLLVEDLVAPVGREGREARRGRLDHRPRHGRGRARAALRPRAADLADHAAQPDERSSICSEPLVGADAAAGWCNADLGDEERERATRTAGKGACRRRARAGAAELVWKSSARGRRSKS